MVKVASLEGGLVVFFYLKHGLVREVSIGGRGVTL